MSRACASLRNASDRVLDYLELFLIEGKFYTIFSVLFGVGFSVLLSRAQTKDVAFHRFYLRRTALLYAFGVAHAVLIWHDDILEAYALCGALLLPFRRARDRTVLIGDRDGNPPHPPDDRLAARLCHLCLLKLGYSNRDPAHGRN